MMLFGSMVYSLDFACHLCLLDVFVLDYFYSESVISKTEQKNSK